MGLNHSPTIVRDGLVLYLDAANRKSYPGSGTTWTDLSGNNLNGTLINGPIFSISNNGYIRTDGTNDYVEVADNSLLDFGSSNFTVEYWFRKLATTSGYDNIWGVNKWNTGGSGGTNEWTLTIGNGSSGAGDNYGFFVEVGPTLYGTGNSATSLVVSTWYQLVGVREGGSLKTYLNGILSQDVSPSGFTSSSAINNAGRSLRVNNSGADFLYTNVDNSIIRIYNRALSATQISQNFNALRGRYGI